MRAFLYARVSTKDKGQETENQLPEMRQRVEFRKWALRREYVDNVSGSGKKIREQFDEMLEACDRHALNIAVLSESGGSKYKTFQGGKHDYIFESRGATPA